jgi:hypothetical protein
MTNRTAMIAELATLTTRNEAGRHFTEFSGYWSELEAEGLIEINRPVHDATGIAYSQEHWTLAPTDEGIAEVEAAGL